MSLNYHDHRTNCTRQKKRVYISYRAAQYDYGVFIHAEITCQMILFRYRLVMIETYNITQHVFKAMNEDSVILLLTYVRMYEGGFYI